MFDDWNRVVDPKGLALAGRTGCHGKMKATWLVHRRTGPIDTTGNSQGYAGQHRTR